MIRVFILLILLSFPAIAAEQKTERELIIIAAKELTMKEKDIDFAHVHVTQLGNNEVEITFGEQPGPLTLDGEPPMVKMNSQTNEILKVSTGCC